MDASNPDLRRLLETARAWGVPWRRFMGWEPVTRTVYRYNGTGQLIEKMTERDPEWGEDDRQAALALAGWEAGVCSGCGGQLAETTDPKNEFRYKAKAAYRCHRCTALDQAAEQYSQSPSPQALHFTADLPDDGSAQ